jgi:hypothetical protein
MYSHPGKQFKKKKMREERRAEGEVWEYNRGR